METVSVIIPTYNRARYVVDAVRSVLRQSHPVDEVLVVDDGSTDDTKQALEPFRDRVVYVRQDNKGAGAARNRGMSEASGDFIAFLDSDDLWIEEKVEAQLRFFQTHPHLEFTFGEMVNFRGGIESGEPEIKNAMLHKYLCENASDLEGLLDCLVVENVIPTPTVMFRRRCLERVGEFAEDLRIAEDLDLWLRFARMCRCGFLKRVLAKRRRHDGNLISDWAAMSACHVEVLLRLAEGDRSLSRRSEQLIKQKIGELRYDLGSYYLKQRNYAQSYRELKDADVTGTSVVKRWVKLALATVAQRTVRSLV